MKLLIIGSGMYVTGRNNTGPGTILSSIAETSKSIPIEEVVIVSKHEKNKEAVLKEAARINDSLGTEVKVDYKPISENFTEDIKKLQEEYKFDAAIVSVPDHLHFDFGKAVLNNNLHCLMVKPLTPTLEEAQSLCDIQSEKNLYGLVEFHKRYDESNLYLKKAISENKIGKLLYFTVDYSQRNDIPCNVFKQWSAKTNIFQYLGIHYVDLIYFMTGYLPYRVSAVGTNGLLKELNIDTFDSIHANIIWQKPGSPENEFVSQFSVNWIDSSKSSAMSDQKYKVIGTEGRIECNQKNRGIQVVTNDGGIQDINPYFSDYLENPDGDLSFSGYGHKSIMQFMIDLKNIKDGKISPRDLDKKRPTFRQSLVSTAVIDAINKSLKNNWEWEKIDESIRSI